MQENPIFYLVPRNLKLFQSMVFLLLQVCPPSDASVALQGHPQLLSVRFENLVHSIFRSENSTMEINVSNFGCCIGSSGSPLYQPLII